MKHLLTLIFVCAAGIVWAQERIEDGTGRNFNIVTEKAAEYPGGQHALYKELFKQLQYPADAKENRVEGDVTVTFFVEPDSTTSEVRALNDLGYGTKEEAERLIKNLKFAPALQAGKPIRQNMMLPVLFRIYD
ncbi:MAG: energy transducer TonB [Bacteroidota bacterium]